MFPLFVPAIVVCYALIRYMGPNGLLQTVLARAGIGGYVSPYLTEWGPVVGLFWEGIPLTLLILLSGLGAVSTTAIEAARDVGAGSLRILFVIVIPLIKRSLLVAFALDVLSIFGAFTTPYLLGPASPEMLGVLMQRTFWQVRDTVQAQTQAVDLLRDLRRSRHPLRSRHRALAPRGPIVRRWRPDIPGLALTVVLALLILAPIATVFLWAFAESWFFPAILPTRWGLRFWDMTLARADVWVALRMSIELSIVVTALSGLICLPAAYAFARIDFPGRQTLLMSFLVTQAFPRFGLYVAIAAIFLRYDLVGTFAGVALIQLLNTLLFMIWIPVGAFQAIDRRLEEAALRRRRQPSAGLPVDHAAAGASGDRRGAAPHLRGDLL